MVSAAPFPFLFKLCTEIDQQRCMPVILSVPSLCSRHCETNTSSRNSAGLYVDTWTSGLLEILWEPFSTSCKSLIGPGREQQTHNCWVIGQGPSNLRMLTPGWLTPISSWGNTWSLTCFGAILVLNSLWVWHLLWPFLGWNPSHSEGLPSFFLLLDLCI